MLGTKLESSVRAVPAFNHQITFPSLKHFLNHLKNRLVLRVLLEETTGREGYSWFGEVTVAFFTLRLGLPFPTSILSHVSCSFLHCPSCAVLFLCVYSEVNAEPLPHVPHGLLSSVMRPDVTIISASPNYPPATLFTHFILSCRPHCDNCQDS